MDIMLESNNDEKTKDESIFVEVSSKNIQTKKQKYAARQKNIWKKINQILNLW